MKNASANTVEPCHGANLANRLSTQKNIGKQKRTKTRMKTQNHQINTFTTQSTILSQECRQIKDKATQAAKNKPFLHQATANSAIFFSSSAVSNGQSTNEVANKFFSHKTSAAIFTCAQMCKIVLSTRPIRQILMKSQRDNCMLSETLNVGADHL